MIRVRRAGSPKTCCRGRSLRSVKVKMSPQAGASSTPSRSVASAADRLLGLLALQGEQGDPARGLGDEPAGDGLAHEAVAAQDEDALSRDVHGPWSIRPADGARDLPTATVMIEAKGVRGCSSW